MKHFLYLLFLPIILMFASCGDEQEEPILKVNSTELTIENKGGSLLLGVTSNVSWSAISSESWCELENYSNKGDGSVIIRVSANTTTSERTAKITVNGGTLICEAIIKQSGNNGNGSDQGDPENGGGDNGENNESDESSYEEMSQQQGVTVSGMEGKYTYVELGLSVMWATYNVGATQPTEYGDLFAWGETTPKETFTWGNYKFYKIKDYEIEEITKYCTKSIYGTVDDKTILDPEDDAASVNWGDSWRMPTEKEMRELRDGCDWERTKDYQGSGVAGQIGKSKLNGNTIFLPAAGFGCDDGRVSEGSLGYYRSSSLYSSNADYACSLHFDRSDPVYVSDDYLNRYHGFSVRAVCPSKK